MINNILTLLGMFLAGIIFMWLRPIIFKRAKNTLINKIDDDTKKELEALYNKGVITVKEYAKKIDKTVGEITGQETFSWNKFGQGFGGLLNPIGWAKDIVGLFNLRKLTIYIFIIGILMGWSYWKGQQNVPISIDLGYGKEAKIDINGEYLHIDKNGNVYLKDSKTNEIIKQISMKDVPDLKRKLAPFGFEFTPIAVIGMGLGNDGVDGEGGIGLSWLRYYKWRLQSFITNRGLYPIGLGYTITKNTTVTLGAGKGYENDERISLFITFKW